MYLSSQKPCINQVIIANDIIYQIVPIYLPVNLLSRPSSWERRQQASCFSLRCQQSQPMTSSRNDQRMAFSQAKKETATEGVYLRCENLSDILLMQTYILTQINDQRRGSIKVSQLIEQNKKLTDVFQEYNKVFTKLQATFRKEETHSMFKLMEFTKILYSTYLLACSQIKSVAVSQFHSSLNNFLSSSWKTMDLVVSSLLSLNHSVAESYEILKKKLEQSRQLQKLNTEQHEFKGQITNSQYQLQIQNFLKGREVVLKISSSNALECNRELLNQVFKTKDHLQQVIDIGNQFQNIDSEVLKEIGRSNFIGQCQRFVRQQNITMVKQHHINIKKIIKVKQLQTADKQIEANFTNDVEIEQKIRQFKEFSKYQLKQLSEQIRNLNHSVQQARKNTLQAKLNHQLDKQRHSEQVKRLNSFIRSLQIQKNDFLHKLSYKDFHGKLSVSTQVHYETAQKQIITDPIIMEKPLPKKNNVQKNERPKLRPVVHQPKKKAAQTRRQYRLNQPQLLQSQQQQTKKAQNEVETRSKLKQKKYKLGKQRSNEYSSVKRQFQSDFQVNQRPITDHSQMHQDLNFQTQQVQERSSLTHSDQNNPHAPIDQHQPFKQHQPYKQHFNLIPDPHCQQSNMFKIQFIPKVSPALQFIPQSIPKVHISSSLRPNEKASRNKPTDLKPIRKPSLESLKKLKPQMQQKQDRNFSVPKENELKLPQKLNDSTSFIQQQKAIQQQILKQRLNRKKYYEKIKKITPLKNVQTPPAKGKELILTWFKRTYQYLKY